MSVLLGRLAEDLSALLDCEWLIAWKKTLSEITAVSAAGECPDLQGCRDETARLLSCAVHHPFQHIPFEAAHLVSLFFPVREYGRIVGVITAGPRRGGTPYVPSDLTVLAEACRYAGILLEQPRIAARLAEDVQSSQAARQDMRAAREVRNRLFTPGPAPLPGIDYYGECRPYGEVGVDFFDYHLLPDGRLSVAIGGVSGRGISSSVVVGAMGASLRGLCGQNLPPARLMAELNLLVCSICPDNFFATMFYAQIDPARRCMSHVNAGHQPPVVLRRQSGRLFRPPMGGPVLGLSRRLGYTETVTGMEEGDLLIGFTDGVTDARNAAGDEFQITRLLGAIHTVSGERASDIVIRVLDEVDRFASVSADDRTVVAVRIRPEPPATMSDSTRVAEILAA